MRVSLGLLSIGFLWMASIGVAADVDGVIVKLDGEQTYFEKDLHKLETLVKADPSIVKKSDRDGDTLLTTAIRKFNWPEGAALLLKYGADVNQTVRWPVARTADGPVAKYLRPLHFSKSEEMTKLLIKYGAEPEGKGVGFERGVAKPEPIDEMLLECRFEAAKPILEKKPMSQVEIERYLSALIFNDKSAWASCGPFVEYFLRISSNKSIPISSNLMSQLIAETRKTADFYRWSYESYLKDPKPENALMLKSQKACAENAERLLRMLQNFEAHSKGASTIHRNIRRSEPERHQS